MTRHHRWFTAKDDASDYARVVGGRYAYATVPERPPERRHMCWRVDWTEPGPDNPCQWSPPHLCGEETK